MFRRDIHRDRISRRVSCFVPDDNVKLEIDGGRELKRVSDATTSPPMRHSMFGFDTSVVTDHVQLLFGCITLGPVIGAVYRDGRPPVSTWKTR
jgi:hypothetical protein